MTCPLVGVSNPMYTYINKGTKMKPLTLILTLATVFWWLGNAPLSAQPSTGNDTTAEMRKAKAAADKAFAEEQEERAAQEVDTIPPTPPAAPRAKSWSTADRSGIAPVGVPFGQNRIQPMIGRGGGAGGKPLVIFSSSPEPKEQANLEEDLAVMAHIFDKSLEDLPGGQPRGFKAAGIDVFFAPGQSPIRSFYLDGYGAVFLLNVSFPLVPPPQKVEREKPAVDSAWAEAQEELFGQPNDLRYGAGMVEEYSDEKVSRLKELLFETLKNASNIRGLKPDDSVTVAVFGGSTSTRAKAKAGAKRALPARDGDMILWQDIEGQGRQTMLTVRVKKADVDAYAKGKLNPEEFQKRARLAAYNSGSAGGIFGSEAGFGAVMGVKRF
jgi:hypothetical protein